MPESPKNSLGQQSENARPADVLIFPAGDPDDPKFVHSVRQEDLIELKYLSRLFTEAREAWEKKRDWVKTALHCGAGVEQGLLTARLVTRKRAGYEVEAGEVCELVVR